MAKTLVGTLDWGLDAQQSVSLIAFGASNSVNTNVGGEHPLVNMANGVNDDPLISGLGSIVRIDLRGEAVDTGGGDPRREGIVLGDTFRP